jgi:ABC-type Zn2+ transport system substrate-binding protein/surface adhesin
LKEIENNKLIALDKFKILRMNMQLSNLFPDLSNIIQSNFKKCEADLAIDFKKSDKKAKNVVNCPFIAKKVIFNDSYDTANYSSDSDNSVQVINIEKNISSENTIKPTNNITQLTMNKNKENNNEILNSQNYNNNIDNNNDTISRNNKNNTNNHKQFDSYSYKNKN